MIGWIIGVGGIVVAAVMWLQSRSQTGRPPIALPPSPLVEGLRPLLSAVEGVRAAFRELTAEDLQLCAPPSATLVLDDAREGMVGIEPQLRILAGGAGPGRQRFLELHRALAAVDPDDRRTLAEAGFDLARLQSALEPRGSAEQWRDDLMLAFEALEKALAQVRHQPYR